MDVNVGMYLKNGPRDTKLATKENKNTNGAHMNITHAVRREHTAVLEASRHRLVAVTGGQHGTVQQ